MFSQREREEAGEKERQISEVMDMLTTRGESFYNIYIYIYIIYYIYIKSPNATLKYFTILYVNYTSIKLFLYIHTYVYMYIIHTHI